MTTTVPPAALTDVLPAAATAKPARYHPALVVLHWLIAILIFSTAFLGGDGGEGRREFRPGTFPQSGFQQGVPQTNPPSNFRPPEAAGGSSLIDIHMLLGLSILVLLIVRLVVRWRTKRPDWASTGNGFLDRVGELTHWALYLFTFLMTITGIVLATQRNLLARLFGMASSVAQGGFRRGGFGFFFGAFHGAIWTLLVLLILLHVGASLYHQFFIKDNLLSRMWFGKRAA